MILTKENADISGCSTLILPSLSIGNVGQLAIDVLLASLKAVRFVASLHHQGLLPVVGQDPLDTSSKRLMTAVQLYRTETEAILQIRSGLVKGQREAFIDDLVEWIKANGFTKVVILTSSASEERLDCQIQGPPFRFISKHFDLKSIGMVELEKRPLEDMFLPGGGFTKILYEKCLAQDIPVVALIAFASEGHNAQDGIGLAKCFNQWTNLVDDMKVPPSWNHFFGAPPPDSLYN